MSQENVEVVRELYAAVARRDENAVFDCYHPDIEWHDHAWLDVGVHRGYDGIRAAHRPFFAQFEQVTFEPYDFAAVGDRVVVSVHVVGRGRGSGVGVERDVPVVFTLRETKISRAEVFSSRAEALEAAGLMG
jgi:ketosteroid isomerase-like protein